MINHSYILYIEDDQSMAELVRQALKLRGYSVVSAQSGQQGLSMMRERKPDLLLLDLMMPNLNGWDIYRAVKTDQTLANIPVIVITARSIANDRTVIADLPPADDYITKPFDVQHLLHSVQNLL